MHLLSDKCNKIVKILNSEYIVVEVITATDKLQIDIFLICLCSVSLHVVTAC